MMADAITNTSPLLYLYRAGILEWLPQLFGQVWTPSAVVQELIEGMKRGYDVPSTADYKWLQIIDPPYIPSEWLALDLGGGELATMALALENRSHIVILDDMLARRTAQAAELEVWGTLRILLESKKQGLTDQIEPFVTRLQHNGMWITPRIRQRILRLANE